MMRLHAGPPGTLIAGFANGMLGLWNIQNGTLLDSARLHGSIAHLLVFEDSLYAATELGSYVVMRLGIFSQDYCELLGDIWNNVPVVWENGLPVALTPPFNHRCRRSRTLHPAPRPAPGE
ncbi:MAG: hypothetical protein V2A73_07670 [Pseudomonadota bacterium]